MSLDDNEILNYLVRMVVPMRREFGRKLDVGQSCTTSICKRALAGARMFTLSI